MKRLIGLSVALGLGLAAASAPAQDGPLAPPPVATVEFLDVGEGDAILIRAPEGKAALVDAGPSHQVVALLRDRGVTALDLVVVSHHHADHYGGMAEVVKAFHPRVFLATNSAQTTPHYLHLLELVRDQGIRAVAPTAEPRTIGLGSVTLTVFPQPPEHPDDENDNSIGLRVQFGTVAFLLTGDSQAAERRWWMERCPDLAAGCAVLKLAHHGSRNGVDARWLGLVQPWLAVASLGKTNDFGHPHRETLELLARSGIPLLRTDEAGTIVVRTDGAHWEVVGHPHSSRGPPGAHRSGAAQPPHEPKGKVEPGGPRVNVNTATAAELETLPGVGPVMAQRIIEGRPYRSVEDLMRVKGVGAKHMETLRPLVSTE